MYIVSSCHFISKEILIYKSVLHNICLQHAKLIHSKHSPYFCYSVWFCQWCRNYTQQLEVLWQYLWNRVMYTEMYICNIYSVDAALRVNFCKCVFVISESISDAVDRQTMLKWIKLNDNLDKRSCTHRLDTLKLLPLLYLLQLANILQRRLLKSAALIASTDMSAWKTDSMNKVL